MSERRETYSAGPENHGPGGTARPAGGPSQPEPKETGPASGQQRAPTLSDLLTQSEMAVLAARVASVLDDGFGDVTITIQKGRVRFVRVSSSYSVNGEDST